VIRPGGLGLTSTTGEALDAVRAHANEVAAELLVLGEHFAVLDERVDGDDLRGRLHLPDGTRVPFRFPNAPVQAAPALALAAATLHQLLPDLPLCLDPVPPPILPCRFEVRPEPDGEVLVLDGAHTSESLAAVARELTRRWPGRRPAVLFGCAAGKRWQQGLSALLPLADSFVVTELSGTPGEDPAAIAAWLRAQGAVGESATDAAAALRRLRQRPGPRLVVGSFYLAGAVRELVDEPGTREPTA
jgi:dihydrofolate synthase/folylpolyglutamate synthase